MALPDHVIAITLLDLQRQYEQGDGNALIRAIRFCGHYELVMPEWVVQAFHTATNRWYRLEVKELGDAFDLAWPKGKHLKAARKRRENRLKVYFRVKELSEQGESIGDELFERVASEYNLNKSLAAELYYQAKRMSTVPKK